MEDVKRTQYSQEGIDFVVLFASKFLNVHVSGYKPLLMEPPESTGGGKQATQHIVLKSQLDGDPLLTAGFVNVATRSAKLRSYDCMQALHRLRFSARPFHVTQPHYQAFFDTAYRFLSSRGMQVDIETAPPQIESAAALPAERKAYSGWWSLAAALVAVLVGALAYLLVSGRLG